MINKISQQLLQILNKKIKLKSIYLHEPDLHLSDLTYLKDCIKNNVVSAAGTFIKKFENKISNLTKAKYVVATNSGTSALHISCILMNIEKNDEVLIPAFTFVATANAVKYCGGVPHFVDIDEDHFGINVQKLDKYLKKNVIKKKNFCINKKTGRKIKAIIPVHVFGHIMKINELIKLAKKYNLKVIEDAAEALGSYYKNKHAGTFGDVGVLSFNGNKTITCGSGGAILTKDKNIAKKARHLIANSKKAHPYNYIHDQIGFNYRMPNLNAALGYSQIKKIRKILAKKRKLFNFYKKAFDKNLYFKLINEPKNSKSNFWLQTILINEKYSNYTKKILKDLNDRKIYVRPGWELMNNLKYFKNCPKMNLSIAKKFYKRIINLPSSSFLVDYIKY